MYKYKYIFIYQQVPTIMHWLLILDEVREQELARHILVGTENHKVSKFGGSEKCKEGMGRNKKEERKGLI